MEPNYIAFAIPAFFIFVGIEYFVAVKQKKPHLFNLENSVVNLSIGIAERLMNLFISASFYQLFYWVYNNFAIFSIPNTWWVWILLILATDLVWYWYHRLGHEINILWAAHIVHHQSEDFNYTVSARITVFQAFIRNIFWCVLPLAGFHPSLVITILLVHGAYSFFTHTQIVGKLGFLEHILVSPSIHGVHHASNEKYLNKNYGDLFVFWDKLFGTYAQEDEKPIYGLTHPLKSYSFLWQHFHYYLEIYAMCKNIPGFWNKLKIIFGRPEDMDQNIRPQLEETFLPNRKQDIKLRGRFRNYILFQLVFSATLLFFVTFYFSEIGWPEKISAALIILLTLINCGALLEQRKWIYHLEQFRILVLLTYFAVSFESLGLFSLTLIIILTVDFVFPAKQYYLSLVYNQKSSEKSNF